MIRHGTKIKKAFFLHIEWISLLTLLILAVTIDTTTSGPSFCILKRMELSFCPGCGLGRSMALAAKGAFHASFQMHPMGIIAIPVMLHRVVYLLFHNHQYKKDYSYEENIRSSSGT